MNTKKHGSILHTQKGKVPQSEAIKRQKERIETKAMQEELEKALKENGINFKKK